jgi:hypothetical protein
MLRQALNLVGQSLGEPSFGSVKIVENSGVEAQVVLAVLALMSCWSMGVIIDRWLTFPLGTRLIARSGAVGGCKPARGELDAGH